MKEYSEELKDARWIQKRQRIIKRDNNKCTACPSTLYLQVHHTYYYNERTEPWNYPDDSLITVCKECHQHHHEYSEIEYRNKPKKHKKKKIVINKSARRKEIKPKKRRGFAYILSQ